MLFQVEVVGKLDLYCRVLAIIVFDRYVLDFDNLVVGGYLDKVGGKVPGDGGVLSIGINILSSLFPIYNRNNNFFYSPDSELDSLYLRILNTLSSSLSMVMVPLLTASIMAL